MSQIVSDASITEHQHDHDHDHGPSMAEQQDRKQKREFFLILLGGILLLAALAARYLLDTPDQGDMIAAVAAVLLGQKIIRDAFKSLITGRCPHDHGHDHSHAHGEACDHDHAHDEPHAHEKSHMEELVALAIIASFASGQYLESGSVAFFMLISSLIEHRTATGAFKAIEDLIRITPTRAFKLVDGQEVEADASELVEGDVVVVRPGDNIPADGVIVSGASTINQANITGESLPVEKSVDDEVFSGTTNETGVLQVRVTSAGKDSTLGKVKDLILQASFSKPAVVRLLDKYASFYTPTVLMIAGIVYFITKDLNNAIVLLLISCPCAIILAAPTGMVAAISAASRLGVYVKNVSDLEVARRISAIIFDKTGTLTVGELDVSRLYPAEGVSPADLLQTAASVEHNSKHPVARALVRTAKKAQIELAQVTDFEEVAGRGVKATIDGQQIIVGREAWVGEMGIDISSLDISEGEGMSLLFVARDGQVLGWVGMEDKVRAGAAHTMDELEDLQIKRRVMITGDRKSPAMKVAQQVHVTDVEYEALPGDKLELVKQLKANGHTVCVIGDGVNDGPALAAGDVSIAMGAAGSDVAINSATVALMNNNLNRLPFLIKLSRSTVTVIRQNLIGTMIYILFMIGLLWAGHLTPLGAAIGHGVSSIIVIFNSARLIREGEDLQDHEPVAQAGTKRQRQIETVEAPAEPA
ncbi:MAG: cadmium-translocating P-type ATPase [Phycisphaeraceae bacterium]|nr:cadmium-translocating P-type ATPase [Phycisphaeraceae bacterium]